MAKKKIAVLTGGGDAPGLNAVIYTLTKTCILKYDYDLIGFKFGYRGLYTNDFMPLTLENTTGILHKGGSILYSSNKDNLFDYKVVENGVAVRKDVSHVAISNLKKDEGKNKAFKLFTAVTVHNIPEGLAVGFAFGSAFATNSPMFSAFLIALGIALQNFPEGLAVALPMHKTLNNKHKAFLYGTASGIVEPIFAILGFFLASQLTFLMPWLLSFSAGAMIYVVVEELLPELHINEKTTIGTWAFMIGFIIMMLLDSCL